MSLTYAKRMKLEGEFMLMKENSPGIKPNFSALARETGVCRQTLTKIWEDPGHHKKPRQKKYQ